MRVQTEAMSVLWLTWKQHDGTQLVIKDLLLRREALSEQIASGGTTYPTMEQTAMATAEAVGRIDEIDMMLAIMQSEVEKDEPEQDPNQDRA